MALFLVILVLAADPDRYADWQESKATEYAGTYHYFRFKGSNVASVERIVISITGEGVALAFTNRKTKTVNYTAVLNKNVVKTSEGEVEGRFVLRYPPDNAKGAVMKGLLVRGRFFVRSSD